MSDWDLSPFNLSPSIWGTIYFRSAVTTTPRRHPITADDVLWLAASAAHEDIESTFCIWCEIQKFCGGNGTNLANFVALFSAPVNPNFAFGLEHFSSGRLLSEPSAGANGIPPRVPGPSDESRRPEFQAWYRANPNGGRPPPSVARWDRLTIWERECLSRGEFRRAQLVGGCSPAVRAEIWANMRLAKNRDNDAWLRLSRRYSANIAAYHICTGQWGNPIPGFDDFASQNSIRSEVTILSDNQADRSRVLSELYVGAGRRGYDPTARAFAFGNTRATDAFQYHKTPRMREAEALVWIVPSSTIGGDDTRRRPVTTVALNGAVPGVIYSGGRSRYVPPRSGGVVETTQEGLAPTEAVPAGTSAMSSSSTNTQTNTTSDPIAVPPPRAEIMQGLVSWADGAEIQLGQSGGGRRQ